MSHRIRLGILRLCDAAPVIFAKHKGLFAQAGLDVTLSVEPSWANIADKLTYDVLDGAVMLPPLAIACSAGLRGRAVELTVPMSLSLEGDSFTLALGLQPLFLRGGMAAVVAHKHVRLAVVHGFSSHNLLLRYWLAMQGIQPNQDVDIIVLPPAEMVGSLAAGAIDGFFAGAPWGGVAENARLGFTALLSHDIWPAHPEKCLALRSEFVAKRPEQTTSLLQVLLRAQSACAAPQSREELAALLALPDYLGLPADLLIKALDPAQGGPIFASPYPHVVQAQWYVRQMEYQNKKAFDLEAVAARIYRPDLLLNTSAGDIKEVKIPEETKMLLVHK